MWMELCAPDGLYVLQPGNCYESGLAVLVAVPIAVQLPVAARVIGVCDRFVAAVARRRRLKRKKKNSTLYYVYKMYVSCT
jgi:hypothetical protein